MYPVYLRADRSNPPPFSSVARPRATPSSESSSLWSAVRNLSRQSKAQPASCWCFRGLTPSIRLGRLDFCPWQSSIFRQSPTFKRKHDIELEAEWGVELSIKGSAVTSLIDVAGAKNVSVRISFKPTGGNNGNYRGYTVTGLAKPSLDAASGWGSALLPQELENITRATGTQANNVVVGTGALQGEQQWERYVKPFTFQVDGGTNKLKFYTGCLPAS